MKSKGERERYIQLNTEFLRTAQRDKGFFIEQCIKLEENSRRGKTRDLFRKTGDIKGTLCPKMGTIKDINGRDHVCLIYMLRNARLDELQAGVKTGGRNINKLDMRRIPPARQRAKRTEEPLDEGGGGE